MKYCCCRGFPQLVANHVERIRQEEASPQKVFNHVKELAEQLFKNVGYWTFCHVTRVIVHLLGIVCHSTIFRVSQPDSLLWFNECIHLLFVWIVFSQSSFAPRRKTRTHLWQCTKSRTLPKMARVGRRIQNCFLAWMKSQCSSLSTMQLPSSRLPHL